LRSIPIAYQRPRDSPISHRKLVLNNRRELSRCGRDAPRTTMRGTHAIGRPYVSATPWIRDETRRRHLGSMAAGERVRARGRFDGGSLDRPPRTGTIPLAADRGGSAGAASGLSPRGRAREWLVDITDRPEGRTTGGRARRSCSAWIAWIAHWYSCGAWAEVRNMGPGQGEDQHGDGTNTGTRLESTTRGVRVLVPTSSPGTRRRGDERSVRGQFVAVKRYTFARIRFFRSSSFTSFATA
jgi:hypothetical protein